MQTELMLFSQNLCFNRYRIIYIVFTQMVVIIIVKIGCHDKSSISMIQVRTKIQNIDGLVMISNLMILFKELIHLSLFF